MTSTGYKIIQEALTKGRDAKLMKALNCFASDYEWIDETYEEIMCLIWGVMGVENLDNFEIRLVDVPAFHCAQIAIFSDKKQKHLLLTISERSLSDEHMDGKGQVIIK